MVPFIPLADLAAHEEELLARLSVHVPVQEPQVGELLPVVSGHLAQQRPLTVHDFIMRKGQDKVFREGVQHAKGQSVVMKPAVNRFLAHVRQRIVHPAHVPFQTEAQSAHIDRP